MSDTVTPAQLAQLKQQLSQIQADITDLQDDLQKRDSQQLQLPLDQTSQAIIGQAVASYLINNLQMILWQKMFWWMCLFESLDGFTFTGTSVSATGTSVTLTTGATSGNAATLQKNPSQQLLLDFAKRIFFRTSFTPNYSNATTYIVVGQAINSTGDQYFGFKVVNGSLFAVASTNGISNETAVQVPGTFSGMLNVEARYFPDANKISFFVNATPTSPDPVCVISSASPLPIGLFSSILFFSTKTSANSAVSLVVSYFEYLQQINVVR